jgi:hypothetical protein
VQERAVRIDARLLERVVFILADENEIARPAPILEQRLECLAHHGLARRAGYAARRLQFIEVVLDEKLAQVGRSVDSRHTVQSLVAYGQGGGAASGVAGLAAEHEISTRRDRKKIVRSP